jgi:hypothetical protein
MNSWEPNTNCLTNFFNHFIKHNSINSVMVADVLEIPDLDEDKINTVFKRTVLANAICSIPAIILLAAPAGSFLHSIPFDIRQLLTFNLMHLQLASYWTKLNSINNIFPRILEIARKQSSMNSETDEIKLVQIKFRISSLKLNLKYEFDDQLEAEALFSQGLEFAHLSEEMELAHIPEKKMHPAPTVHNNIVINSLTNFFHNYHRQLMVNPEVLDDISQDNAIEGEKIQKIFFETIPKTFHKNVIYFLIGSKDPNSILYSFPKDVRNEVFFKFVTPINYAEKWSKLLSDLPALNSIYTLKCLEKQKQLTKDAAIKSHLENEIKKHKILFTAQRKFSFFKES